MNGLFGNGLLRTVLIVIFALLSLSRSAAQVMYYRAPLEMWRRAGVYARGDGDGRSTICVGKEWHRVPSTLFVSDAATVKWMDDGFDGQLPAMFEATDATTQPFNDA